MAPRFRFFFLSHGIRRVSTAKAYLPVRWYTSASSGPLAVYNSRVQRGELQANDLAQQRAVAALDALYQQLRQAEESSWWQVVAKWGQPTKPSGIYMHGTVGTGKTFLMDLFYSQAPNVRKRRVHFHSFMLDVHRRLHEQGKADNAVQLVALQVLDQARLLCLDEVEVTDIADALMLKRLFEVLWPMGMVVVATSNSAPDQLYSNGLNRQLFLPFIRQLKEYCHVYSLDAHNGVENDYRRCNSQLPHLYFYPQAETVDRIMNQIFLELTGGVEGRSHSVVVVMGRMLQIVAAKDIARASFAYLCASAFGAADYIALSGNFSILFLDRIPQLGDSTSENEARRFITLVDVLYESNTVLICSAAVAPDLLFVDPSQIQQVPKNDNCETTDFRVVGEGGSSGRSTLMIGHVEWSATGRQGVSLASLAGSSFTRKAAPRAVSRLLEMQTEPYLVRAGKAHVLQLLQKFDKDLSGVPPQ